MKILLLDIETAPNLAYVWGTWQQNINPEWKGLCCNHDDEVPTLSVL